MPQVIEKTVFAYSELTGAAQERARQWWISCCDEQDFDFVIEDFERVCEALGVELAETPVKLYGGGTRHKPCVYWSLSYSQGDGASFDGRYSYAKGSTKAIRAYAGTDTVLHGIADRLADIQRRNFYGIEAKIVQGRYGAHYVRSNTMNADVFDRNGNDARDDVASAVQDEMRALADWLFRQLRAEDEYQCREEAISEAMEANEYRFDEQGRIE